MKGYTEEDAEGKPDPGMILKILLPYRILTEQRGVRRIIAESSGGSFGLLPRRLDMAVDLVAGILAYTTSTGQEVFVAVDEGVLVKAGPEVLVSVRNGFEGPDLGSLRGRVEREFRHLDAQESGLRNALAVLESEFIRRFQKLETH